VYIYRPNPSVVRLLKTVNHVAMYTVTDGRSQRLMRKGWSQNNVYHRSDGAALLIASVLGFLLSAQTKQLVGIFVSCLCVIVALMFGSIFFVTVS